jgi:hypothetical protein
MILSFRRPIPRCEGQMLTRPLNGIVQGLLDNPLGEAEVVATCQVVRENGLVSLFSTCRVKPALRATSPGGRGDSIERRASLARNARAGRDSQLIFGLVPVVNMRTVAPGLPIIPSSIEHDRPKSQPGPLASRHLPTISVVTRNS